MRTLHFGLRVADLDRPLAFYAAIGYEVVGEVPESPIGRLVMLKLPGDEFVSVELVHDPSGNTVEPETRLSHFVIHVDSMGDATEKLRASGITTEAPTSPDGSKDLLTLMITDPDGNQVELVQWPVGHADGMSAADFPER